MWNKVIDLLQKERGLRDGRKERERVGDEQRVKMFDVCVPTQHDVANHYILQTCNKIKINN